MWSSGVGDGGPESGGGGLELHGYDRSGKSGLGGESPGRLVGVNKWNEVTNAMDLCRGGVKVQGRS